MKANHKLKIFTFSSRFLNSELLSLQSHRFSRLTDFETEFVDDYRSANLLIVDQYLLNFVISSLEEEFKNHKEYEKKIIIQLNDLEALLPLSSPSSSDESLFYKFEVSWGDISPYYLLSLFIKSVEILYHVK
jgi:hypothetical protein